MSSVPNLLSQYGDDTLASAGAKIFLNGMNTIRNTTNGKTNDALINLQKVCLNLLKIFSWK